MTTSTPQSYRAPRPLDRDTAERCAEVADIKVRELEARAKEMKNTGNPETAAALNLAAAQVDLVGSIIRSLLSAEPAPTLTKNSLIHLIEHHIGTWIKETPTALSLFPTAARQDARDLAQAILSRRAEPPTVADMRAFGASHVACYKWPDDSELHRACRAAYIEGAYDAEPQPTPGEGEVEAQQDFVKVIGTITNYIENERVRCYNEGVDAGRRLSQTQAGRQ